ncbi:MAG: two-component system OmpR family response regulator [Verrucomicrobiales bacterium]|jgi:two-component system OmpR family response regulator
MRVLLVEDELTLADSVRRGLEAEGMTVDHEGDGIDGLWRATEGEYDVLVLDIMLPGLNGYEICRKLRENEVWTPILMLTAKDGEYDEADAFDLGADDYLRKPFSHVVLVARLRSLVRRGATARPQVMTIGDLELDPGAMQCRRGGEAVQLTPREFSVLETLVRRSPLVVSKSELLDAVWGMDFEGDPNIIEVYVGYVRRKIDRPFGTETVKTVRGVGYQIVGRQIVGDQ